MANPHLSAVPNEPLPATDADQVHEVARIAETGAQRIKRLQQEARGLAREQVEALAREIHAIAARALEISEAGEVYPAGVRELASRMAEDLPQKAHILTTIMDRNAQG